MANYLTSPRGATSNETNKESLARIFGVKKTDVGVLNTSVAVDSYSILYDKTSCKAFYRGAATGTPTSWSVSSEVMTLVTSSGTYTLYSASKEYLGDYSESTVTLSSSKEYITYLGEEYKLKSSVSSYTTTGTTATTWTTDSENFVARIDYTLREDLSSTSGASLSYTSQGGSVQDIIGEVVTLESMGVYYQSVSDVKAGNAVDMTELFQSAVNKAKSLGVPLVSNEAVVIGPSANKVIYLKSDVNITGLLETRGSLVFGILSTTFNGTFATPDDTPRYPVLRNMNATYDSSTGKQYYGTSAGFQRLDAIQVSSLDAIPASNIIGQLHTCAYTHFRGDLVGRKFATAIRFANCYDNSVSGQVYALDSGTIDYYPLEIGSYPYYDTADESNSMTFNNIILHTNNYRDASIIGSKINVNRIHCEASVIGDLTNLTQNSVDKLSATGFNTFNFASVGGTIGNLDIMPSSSSTNSGTYLLNTMNTSASTVHGSAKAHLHISDIYYLGMGGTVSSIYTLGDVTVGGGGVTVVDKLVCGGNLNPTNASATINFAKVTGNVTTNSSKINKLIASGTYTQNQYGSLLGGSIAGTTTVNNSSKISDVTFTGAVVNSATGSRFLRCTFSSTLTNNSTGIYEDCTFGSSFTLTAGTYRKCSFTTLTPTSTTSVAGSFFNCSIGSLSIVNNSSMAVFLYECSIGGTQSMSGSSGYLVIDPSCRITGSNTSFTGWAQPTSTGAGYGAETINPYTGTGWRLVYSGTSAYWATVTKYTS